MLRLFLTLSFTILSLQFHVGTVSFNHYDRLKTVIDNITSVRHGNIYAEARRVESPSI